MSQNLKFRLQDGHLYEFKYSKYSDFIDNLEPESGVIIDVLEPFTLEDFETAQIEYNKYVVFKEALEDIIKNKKLWFRRELKEFSKYDLDNPVLEWLMIRDNREDKEIKKILYYNYDDLDYLSFNEELKIKKMDSIILYYLLNGNKQRKFNLACKNGHLKVAQWLYTYNGIYEGDKINIHHYFETPFISACENGHLEVAQWLFSLGEKEEKIKIHIDEDRAFTWACANGHLEVAQWLYSLGGVNIHARNDDAFCWSCKKGHLEVSQWLYSLGGVNIHSADDFAFKWACYNSHLEVAQWLWSLGGFHKNDIKTTHQPINDWLATLE
jgi:ankyrin repeat protein